MKKILVVLLVLINFSLNSFGQDKDKGLADRKIGIVNVSEVYAKYLRKVDLEKGWKLDNAAINEKIKAKNNALEKLKEEFSLADDELDKEKIWNDLKKGDKELKFFVELNEERIQRDISKCQLEMIQEIKKTIQDYGEINRFFLILQTRPINSKEKTNLQEAILMINLSDVMYYDKNYDITDKIIVMINDRWAALNSKNTDKKTPNK